MKSKFLLSLITLLFPLFSFAQSNLTIFSEDGDRFFLVLNGQRQNEMPQTNVRIEGLSQPYYTAKIVFEDKAKPEISKNLQVVDPSNNSFADVTYKIKKTKDGELKIRYFSATAIQPNYVAPADVYVTHYGGPAGAVTQQTTTTTTSSGYGGASANVNAGGVNMNVSVNDPNMQVTQTTTTRTTTTTTSSGYSSGYDAQAQPQQQTGCQWPMNQHDFASAKASINDASFDDTKLSTAKSIIDGNCLSAEQVCQICTMFSFEQSRLDFAKYAYSKTTDPGNYFKVNKSMQFESSKTELNNYISSHR